MLASLSAMREAPQSEQARAELTRALEHRSSAIVAHAARIAGEVESVALVPALVEAFGRLMVNPSKRDPGCIGKREIANALYLIGPRDPGVFLSGIRHVQIEGPGDVAADLRGICAHGLVRIGYSDALEELAELLVDPEASARRAAVRALAYRGHQSAGPVLRLKLKLGDSDAEIVSDALVALLKLGGGFCASFRSPLPERPVDLSGRIRCAGPGQRASPGRSRDSPAPAPWGPRFRVASNHHDLDRESAR